MINPDEVNIEKDARLGMYAVYCSGVEIGSYGHDADVVFIYRNLLEEGLRRDFLAAVKRIFPEANIDAIKVVFL